MFGRHLLMCQQDKRSKSRKLTASKGRAAGKKTKGMAKTTDEKLVSKSDGEGKESDGDEVEQKTGKKRAKSTTQAKTKRLRRREVGH